jgi:hypothetical protein
LDVQDLDARVTSDAHERVAVLSLRPYDTVVVELLVVGGGVLCGVLFVFKPPQDLDGAVAVQFRATYDDKRASAHGENRVDAGGGIGIEFHVVELG